MMCFGDGHVDHEVGFDCAQGSGQIVAVVLGLDAQFGSAGGGRARADVDPAGQGDIGIGGDVFGPGLAHPARTDQESS